MTALANDAPVTVEQWRTGDDKPVVEQRHRDAAAWAMDRTPDSLTWDNATASHVTPDRRWQMNRVAEAMARMERDTIARHRLAALASAPAETEPFAVDAKVEYPAFKSWWERTIPHEPAPSAASHHFDAWMASARNRVASAPAGDGVAEVRDEGPIPEARSSLITRAVRQSLRKYGHKVAESSLPECIASDVEATLRTMRDDHPALARPRAAVGEREAIARVIDEYPFNNNARDSLASRDREKIAYRKADAILALQAPPAKVEP